MKLKLTMKSLAIVFILVFLSCTQKKDFSEQSAIEIGDADRAMSMLASKEGFNRALLRD